MGSRENVSKSKGWSGGSGRNGIDRKAVLALFERFAAKGAVNLPGPRATADKAWQELKVWLKPENRMRFLTARGHALCIANPDRGEFDALVAKLRPEFEAFAGVKKQEPTEADVNALVGEGLRDGTLAMEPGFDSKGDLVEVSLVVKEND